MISAGLKAYPGTSVLEVMVEANNYNHYLASLIDIDLQLHFRVLDLVNSAPLSETIVLGRPRRIGGL